MSVPVPVRGAAPQQESGQAGEEEEEEEEEEDAEDEVNIPGETVATQSISATWEI